jgi:hypothetical protein
MRKWFLVYSESGISWKIRKINFVDACGGGCVAVKYEICYKLVLFLDKNKWFSGMEMDIKFQIGNIIINILNISYEPPRPSWYYKNLAHSGFELHFIPEG